MSGLWNYVDAVGSIYRELESSLGFEDVESLRQDLVALKLQGWKQWLADHKEEVVGFATATPSARAKKKSWQEPTKRRRLVLAAMYEAADARLMLNSVSEHWLEPGGPYRSMLGSAAQALQSLLREYRKQPLWLFDDPDPFAAPDGS